MGLNQPREKKNYLSVYKGNIVQRVTENTPNAVERVNKNGEKIYELVGTSISAEIRDIYVEDTDFGEQCRVLLNDMGTEYVLNIPTDSGLFDSFAKKTPNIKSHTFYTIKPYDFVGKDEKRTVGVNIYEEENKVEPFFTKENPGKMPKFPTTGKKSDIQIWGISKREFLVEVVKKAGEKLRNANPSNVMDNSAKKGGSNVVEEKDDLPF